MAAWLGAAQQLARRKNEWSGTLVMILQPAERSERARCHAERRAIHSLSQTDYAIAFHDAAQFPAGMIGYSPASRCAMWTAWTSPSRCRRARCLSAYSQRPNRLGQFHRDEVANACQP
jgi:metal-dependent amidase/aminoacylase/carboxypeptidase family protein